MRRAMVRYEVKPGRTAENEQLVRTVTELHEVGSYRFREGPL